MEFEKEVPFQLGKEYCGGYLNILEGESAFFESPDKPFWKDFFGKFSKKSLEYRVETWLPDVYKLNLISWRCNLKNKTML